MLKYNFSVDGIPVAIYPATELGAVMGEVLRDLREFALGVVLLPDSSADFRIECFDKNNTEPREPHLPIAALSCFFERVRGYPDMSLDIAYKDRCIKLSLDKANRYKFSVNDGKCKILYTKTVEFGDGISINAEVVDSPCSCAAVICNDAECFDAVRLGLLLGRLREVGISSVAVISYTDRLVVRTLGDIAYYDAVRVALSLLSSRGIVLTPGRYSMDINGLCREFSRTRAGAVFYPEIKYIS